MNKITDALATAGVKLPTLSRRIWQYLKDNGPHSSKDVAAELNVPYSHVTGTASDMCARKMLRLEKRTDARGKRMAALYNALGREYEVLPIPKSGRKEPTQPAPIPPAPPEDNTLTLRVPVSVYNKFQAHAQEYGVPVQEVVRLALSAYAAKMALDVPGLDPTATLRRKLAEGGV